MPLTILIAAAASPGGLSADEVTAQVSRGALGAAPYAVTSRATPDDAQLSRADLVLAAGCSALTSAIVARAVELGIDAVVLGGSLRGAGAERHPTGVVAYEPDAAPGSIDAGLAVARLRQGARHAVDMALGCHRTA